MRSVPLLIGLGFAAGGAHAGPAPVIGGSDVPEGKWRDVAAVLFDGEQGCTGVLIAPTVVMTAGHCIDSSLDAVLIGTNSLARPSAGEKLDVVRRIDFPGFKYDVGLVVLAQPSTMPVRRLATGWIQDQIVDGARVAFVGYGAVDRDANEYIFEMQEAESTITDAGCTRRAGCDPAARPDGEIGAGGAGIDTCPGDSGGPMYLLTDDGAFVAGITSRGYDDNQFPCSEGGIYTRPDKDEIVAWVETETGEFLHDGRGPLATDLTIALGDSRSVHVDANDPMAGASHTWEIVTPPATGTATIAADGTLTVTAPGEVGETFVVVRATDAGNPARSARARIAVRYVEGDDGGCCGTTRGSPLGALGLTGAVALLLRRRRGRA